MNRSLSPVHLHVSRKAPVHVHVSTSPVLDKKASSRRMRASDWVKASTSKGPWIPPPGRTTRQISTSGGATRMSWEGPTHRLDIEPGYNADGTCLHVSDLNSGANGSTDIILEPAESNGTHTKLDSLRAEVSSLKNEMERQKNLRELDERELEIRAQSRLNSRGGGGGGKRMRSTSPVSKLLAESYDAEQVNTNRESLMQTLTETELDLNSVNRQIDLLKETLRLLIRDKSLSPSRAREATDQTCVLQERLSELLLSLKTAKHLIRSQQTKESKIKHYTEEIESLLKKLTESEASVQSFRRELQDKESLTIHSQQLHEHLNEKEKELTELTMKIKSLEETLSQNEFEYAKLKSEFQTMKRKADLDKDTLKRSNKQQKDKVLKTEKSIEALNTQVDCLISELDLERSKSSRTSREKAQMESDLGCLKNQIKDVEKSFSAVSAKLSQRNREYGALQIENDQNKATVVSLESRLQTQENQLLSAQNTLSDAQGTIAQYETLLRDYKTQLDKHEQELHQKEQEIERLQHESYIDMEKSKIAYQKQLSEMEPIADELKAATIKLQDSKERLAQYEQATADQTRMIADLRIKSSSVDNLKEKLQDKKSEVKTAAVKIELLEKKLADSDKQNKDLLLITSKKEELIQQLQFKEEQYIEEIASLNRQLDSSRSDARRQIEDMKNRNESKERSQLARIADLEAQVGRVNAQLSQMQKTKDEVERKSQSKVRELQERLDQSQATRKSLESYVNFLKSSYSSIFNDTSSPVWKSPLTH
ncbi:PREDICTED: outer dense fiber protein 2-like [Amphimedon queenslandica]|uniref:Outer dense fiber protein 2 n=1 Tax=Amphimedon queenslandica TaxID=400682 RepID=A0A1X7UWQ5_AMPQE|nr:PREDICTED: outer dense fiber protein 2-like [Amphimedon queenslandica]|eukprot:XP_003386665.2 PREDICTED: outer dense fiber protein 2-like [Amphimedon queenslandica]